MAVFDTIAFPDYDGITGLPTLDGWTGNTDPGVTTVNFPEAGFAPGSRITFSGGAVVPPVVFETLHTQLAGGNPYGVAAGSYLWLSFFCSFDPTFDTSDGVTISMIPDFATKDHHAARRIDLLPNTASGAPGTGFGMSQFDWLPPENPPSPFDPATAHPTYYSKLNRQPVVNIYKGIDDDGAGNVWTQINPTNVAAKCASWVPATLSTTTTADVVIPAAPTGAHAAPDIPVVDTTQFPASGDITGLVGGVLVQIAYTGKTATSFTGCTVAKGTAAGTLLNGTTVQLMDVGWSVELLFPATVALGGADWIDLQAHFGLYMNLFRFSKVEPSPAQPHASFYAAQYRFPLPDAGAPLADQHYLAGQLDTKLAIDENWMGKATINALAGGNDALGVRFQNHASPASSIGARHTLGGPIDNTLYGASGTQDNTLVAQIENTGTSAANDITADFRFASWGLPPATFGAWDPASAHGAAATSHLNLAAGGSGEVTEDWAHGNVPADYAISTVWPGHHCMWVELSSTQNVNFVEGGARTNMNFQNLSDSEQPATISGSGYPTPSSGHHDMVLFSHVRSMFVPDRGGDGEIGLASFVSHQEGQVKGKLVWYWSVNAFRRTGQTLQVGDDVGEIIDPSPGEFGMIALHDGDDSHVFAHQLSGGGIKRRGNAYELRVPHNGEVKVNTWVGAGAPGTVTPPTPTPTPSTDPWWVRFIKWLIALIRSIFK
ncbi:MAG TPA: hypothetical protein VGQ38_05320 [Gaiellaceae bacterium]|jgi:hypothetical protein|nr:hypothetical protein [Gaiellaceae bacterium]